MGVTSRGWRTPESSDKPDIAVLVGNTAKDANDDLQEVDARLTAKTGQLDTGLTVAQESVAAAAASAAAAKASAATASALLVDAQAPTDAFVAGIFNDPASSVRQTAGAIYAPVQAALRGNRVVFLGDSITAAQGSDEQAGGEAAWGTSWPTHATYASKGRLLRVRNAGVPGHRTGDMLARFAVDVAAWAPSVVAIMAGTNNWNDAGPSTLAQYQADIEALVAKCRAISAAPILCTVPPNTISPARQKRTIIGNTWLRQYAAEQGITLVDFYAFLVDPATGDWLPAYGTSGNDKTHPINPGYVAMGKFFWTTVAPMFPAVDQLLPMENADPNNLLPNGLNLTTTGAGTTLMPTGWTVQGSVHAAGVTGSLVTGDAAIKGNWWKVTADGTATGVDNEYVSVGGIIPGHKYAHVGRFKATGLRNGDAGAGSQVLLGVAFNSSLLVAGHDFRVVNTSSYDEQDGVYYMEMVAPAGAATALVRRQLLNTTAGAGTLQVAQQGFYDLTAMGLA